MRAERGITGLETAIILIAFVVVASVFAFTILSVGIFASERSKETTLAGVEEARSTLAPSGAMIAFRDTVTGIDGITRLRFNVTLSNAGAPIDLTPSWTAAASGVSPVASGGISGPTVISYTDKNQHVSDANWTVAWLGKSDGDNIIEDRETAEITVWLHARNVSDAWSIGTTTDAFLDTRLIANHWFDISVDPNVGSAFQLERTVPPQMDAVMSLN
jgi:flagellin FlaB